MRIFHIINIKQVFINISEFVVCCVIPHARLEHARVLHVFSLHRSCPHVYQLVVRGYFDPDFLHHVLPL